MGDRGTRAMTRDKLASRLDSEHMQGTGATNATGGQARRDEKRRQRSHLPPDLRSNPPFVSNAYAWDTFGSWEFNLPRHVAYMGDVE
jgi:hypothetical protein